MSLARPLLLVWLAALGCSPAPEPVVSGPGHSESTAFTSSSPHAPAAVAPLSTGAPTSFPEAWGCPPVESPVEDLGELKQAVALTADETALYWTDGVKLFQTPLDGGAAVVLARTPAGTTPIVDVHARKGEVFFSSRRDLGLQCLGALSSFSPSTSTVSTIKSACVNSFSASDTLVAYVARVVIENSYAVGRGEVFDRRTKNTITMFESLAEQSGIAVAGDYVFMANTTGRFLRRRADGSSSVEVLAPNSTVPTDFMYGDERFVAADATGAYAYASGTGNGQRIFHVHATEDRITQLGMEPNEVVVQDAPPPGRFAESERHLYWAATQNGEVRRVDRRGKCGMEVVVKNRRHPRWASFANGSVYWLEDGPKGQPTLARRKL